MKGAGAETGRTRVVCLMDGSESPSSLAYRGDDISVVVIGDIVITHECTEYQSLLELAMTNRRLGTILGGVKLELNLE